MLKEQLQNRINPIHRDRIIEEKSIGIAYVVDITRLQQTCAAPPLSQASVDSCMGGGK